MSEMNDEIMFANLPVPPQATRLFVSKGAYRLRSAAYTVWLAEAGRTVKSTLERAGDDWNATTEGQLYGLTVYAGVPATRYLHELVLPVSELIAMYHVVGRSWRLEEISVKRSQHVPKAKMQVTVKWV